MKKISSEIKFDDNQFFKVKWGTTDKKLPYSIYLEMGTYVTPKLESDSYSEKIRNFDKSFRTVLDRYHASYNNAVSSNCIIVTDIAEGRVEYGKKSYMTVQATLVLKPSYIYGKLNSGGFKSIVEDIHIWYNNMPNDFRNILEDNGFECSKTKN